MPRGKLRSKNSPKGSFDDAIAARDAKLAEIAELSSKERGKVSTVVGGVNRETGATAVGVKRSGENYGKCAEDLCTEQLGDPSNVLMSPAIRPRGNKVIPVCKRCQTKYAPEQFPPGTVFED